MRIFKLFLRFIICILCICCLCRVSVAEINLPDVVKETIAEQTDQLKTEAIQIFSTNISNDIEHFKPNMDLNPKTFVPIEAKIGLMFMKALSVFDGILQISLVRFMITFLLFMYAFWVGLEAYKLIHTSGDYKTVLYNIFKQGITIGIWIIVLNYGPAKIFSMLVSPILGLGTYLSDFLLGTVAETYKVNIPDTCAAIQNYVNTNTSLDLIIDSDTAANIMCLPSRMSVYFYHATATGFRWIKDGIGNSITMVIVGILSIIIFVKCIFKYAFMTLGIVADLFLKLLLLPFTALAESMPATKEDHFFAKVFSGLRSVFDTAKLSSVISVFINTAIYFVSLSIVISICALLLTNIISFGTASEYTLGGAITTLITGCLVLYLVGQLDNLIKNIGGSIDNSFGKQLMDDAKLLWNGAKNLSMKIFKN